VNKELLLLVLLATRKTCAVRKEALDAKRAIAAHVGAATFLRTPDVVNSAEPKVTMKINVLMGVDEE